MIKAEPPGRASLPGVCYVKIKHSGLWGFFLDLNCLYGDAVVLSGLKKTENR